MWKSVSSPNHHRPIIHDHRDSKITSDENWNSFNGSTHKSKLAGIILELPTIIITGDGRECVDSLRLNFSIQTEYFVSHSRPYTTAQLTYVTGRIYDWIYSLSRPTHCLLSAAKKTNVMTTTRTTHRCEDWCSRRSLLEKYEYIWKLWLEENASDCGVPRVTETYMFFSIHCGHSGRLVVGTTLVRHSTHSPATDCLSPGEILFDQSVGRYVDLRSETNQFELHF